MSVAAGPWVYLPCQVLVSLPCRCCCSLVNLPHADLHSCIYLPEDPTCDRLVNAAVGHEWGGRPSLWPAEGRLPPSAPKRVFLPPMRQAPHEGAWRQAVALPNVPSFDLLPSVYSAAQKLVGSIFLTCILSLPSEALLSTSGLFKSCTSQRKVWPLAGC